MTTASTVAPSAGWEVRNTSGQGCINFLTREGFHGPADDSTVFLDTGQELLSGHQVEGLSLVGGRFSTDGPYRCLSNDDFTVGLLQVETDSQSLEQASYGIYRQILSAVGDRSLYRIWNYVPSINHEEPGLLENYKLFCIGRSRAFADTFGDGDTSHFPSASGTGCSSNKLSVVYLAGYPEVEHYENPEQVPAYRYPRQYGPRSPAFSRASRFTGTDGSEWVLIAGTASIKGSETRFPGQFEAQLDTTFDNIRIMLAQVGLDLKGGGRRRRHFKVFLRHRGNLQEMEAALLGQLGPHDTYSIVEAEICRADLEVEIELTVFPGS